MSTQQGRNKVGKRLACARACFGEQGPAAPKHIRNVDRHLALALSGLKGVDGAGEGAPFGIEYLLDAFPEGQLFG